MKRTTRPADGSRLRRGGGVPEHNLVQNPEVLGKMAKFLGMRQAHVAPAVTEGITPVLVVGDISGRGTGSLIMKGASTLTPAPGGVLTPASALHNSASSGVRVRVRELEFTGLSSATGIPVFGLFIANENAFVTALAADLVYTLSPPQQTGPASIAVGVFPRAGGIPLLAVTNAMKRWKLGDFVPQRVAFGGDGVALDPGKIMLLVHDDPTVGSMYANWTWTEEPAA